MDKNNETHFYKVFITPSSKAGTGVLCKYFTSLNNAIIAGNNNLLDKTGHYQIKEYFLSKGDVVIIGGDSSTDSGILVWDSRFSFECNMDKSYKDIDADGFTDEFGAAFLWDKTGDCGAEYNFCLDHGTNACAIYKMEMDKEADVMRTDYSTFEHYEIDFDNPHWEDELRAAMTTAYSHFFLAEERTQSQIQTL